MGTFFAYSNQARYTAGLNADPGWLISTSWSTLPATLGSAVTEGSRLGAYTSSSPVSGSIVTIAALWHSQPASSPRSIASLAIARASRVASQSSVVRTVQPALCTLVRQSGTFSSFGSSPASHIRTSRGSTWLSMKADASCAAVVAAGYT